MAPICPVGLKTTISNFVKKISAGGNKVNVLQETEKLLTSTGKKYTIQRGAFNNLVHAGSGEKMLSATEIPGSFTMLAGQTRRGNCFNYSIHQNGSIVDNVLLKNTSISKDAEQILFDILA